MSARRSMYANRLGQRGFTIVEALVALVVLAVGMLGIASLYVTTLRASGSAMSRMQAINLASDLGDRIRANRTAEDDMPARPRRTAPRASVLARPALPRKWPRTTCSSGRRRYSRHCLAHPRAR